MGMIYRPSTSSRSSSSSGSGSGSNNRYNYSTYNKNKQSNSSSTDSRTVVRAVFWIANVVSLGIVIIPVFIASGFVAGIGTLVVCAIVSVPLILIANWATKIHPTLGFFVSGGVVGAFIFTGIVLVHTVFPLTLSSINLSATHFANSVKTTASLRTMNVAQDATFICPVSIDNRLMLSITSQSGTKELEIPQNFYMTFFERLRYNLGINVEVDISSRMAEGLEEIKEYIQNKTITSSGDHLLVVDGNITNTSFQSLFPDKIVLRTMSTNNSLIQQNMERLLSTPSLTPETTAIINGIPSSKTELENTGLDPQEWSKWESLSEKWSESVTGNGFNIVGSSAKATISAFEEKANVLVLVAHSDGFKIYFPDGSNLSIDDLAEVKSKIMENNPMVALFSCETAKVDKNLSSFASKLIDLGARAVVAPTQQIGAETSLEFLDSFLNNSQKGISMLEALKKAVEHTKQTILETWIASLSLRKEYRMISC